MKCLLCIFLSIINISVLFGQNNSVDIANQYIINGEYHKALEIFQNLEVTEPNKIAFFDAYFNVLLKTKKVEKAEQLLKDVSVNHANETIVKLNEGYLYFIKGDSIKADKIFTELIKNSSANEFDIASLSNMFINKELYKYAISNFLYGRKQARNDNIYGLDLANLYANIGDKKNTASEILNLVILNPAYVAYAKAMIAKHFATAEHQNLIKNEIIKRIQKNTNTITFNELLAYVFIQQKNFDSAINELIALDKRQISQTAQIFSIGQMSIQNKDYHSAQKAFSYITSSGKENAYYLDALIYSLQAREQLFENVNFNNEDILKLVADYKSIIKSYGINSQTQFAIISLSKILFTRLNQKDNAIKLLEDAILTDQLKNQQLAEVKLLLASFYVNMDNFWEAKLLLSQVEKELANENFGQQARFNNAKISYYVGEFKWAKSQFDILKASTSQNISNDSFDLSSIISNSLEVDSSGSLLKKISSADLFFERGDYDKAIKTLDSVELLPNHQTLLDYLFLQKGKILTQTKEFSKAALAYQKVIDNYSESLFRDDALFLLANLQEFTLQKPNEAMANYLKIINEYTTSAYMLEAKERYRRLKGVD